MRVTTPPLGLRGWLTALSPTGGLLCSVASHKARPSCERGKGPKPREGVALPAASPLADLRLDVQEGAELLELKGAASQVGVCVLAPAGATRERKVCQLQTARSRPRPLLRVAGCVQSWERRGVTARVATHRVSHRSSSDDTSGALYGRLRAGTGGAVILVLDGGQTELVWTGESCHSRLGAANEGGRTPILLTKRRHMAAVTAANPSPWRSPLVENQGPAGLRERLHHVTQRGRAGAARLALARHRQQACGATVWRGAGSRGSSLLIKGLGTPSRRSDDQSSTCLPAEMQTRASHERVAMSAQRSTAPRGQRPHADKPSSGPV